MKRIITSLLSVAVVGGLAIGATQAFFSNSEVSNNNKITAGTIDLEVSTGGPDTKFVPVDIQDMKPSYVRWTKHIVRNTGTNPLKLWKRITNLATSENGTTDAERDWYAANPDEIDQETGQKNNIDDYIEYDMYLGGDIEGGDEADNWLGGHNNGGQVVIDEDDGITLSDIEGVYIYLGQLEPAGATEGTDQMVVWQSYHMKDETENWAQTDLLKFSIEFYGEQANGNGPIGGAGQQKLLLENKDPSTWEPYLGDGRWGILTWAGDGDTFDFSSTLKAYGLNPSTEYSLIYAPDPWPQEVAGVNTVLGTDESDEYGNLEISGNQNLGYDIPHPGDINTAGGKIWLVLSNDHSGQKMTSWNPKEYLFETNLITYDDWDN